MATVIKENEENQKNNDCPHIGQLVYGILQKKRYYSAALARQLDKNITTVLRYYKAPSVQASIVWELSIAMKHNFFADIAAQLPADFAGAKDEVLAAKDDEIAALQQTVDKLQGEKDLLMQVIKQINSQPSKSL